MISIEPHLVGNAQSGFWTELHAHTAVLAHQNGGGEFDLLVESGDRVDRQEIHAWRADTYVEAKGRLTLTGTIRLPLFNTELAVTVTYESVTAQVIKKTIRLYQSNIPRLFHCLRNSLDAPEVPENYWSFDHANHSGGPAYGVLADDVFPAVGYVLPGNLVIGLLTDSGWVNGWARYGYRRSAGGNMPAIELVDPALLRTATVMERAAGKHYVSLTLGELYGNSPVPLETNDAANGNFRFLGRQGYLYSIVFEHGPARELVFALQGPSGQLAFHQVEVLAAAANAAETGWQSIVFRLPALPESGNYALSITAVGGLPTFRRLRLFEASPEPRPWHTLRQGEALERILFLFAEAFPPTPRNMRLHSQLHLADGLGFHGSVPEKVLSADARMLTWTSEPGLAEPMVVPGISYFEMYLRDAFWILNGLPDRFLNENVLRRMGETISAEGNVGNIITAYHGSIEYKPNELAYLYLIWSLRNRLRFGSPPDMEKVRRVVGFIRRTFDPDGDGVVLVNNPQSSADVIWQDRPCRFAVSQGYYALALRVAQALGGDVAHGDIASAEEAYRGYYDDYGAQGAFLHSFPDNRLENGEPAGIISHVDLVPEFLSLYLFDHPMLTPQIVIDTLEKYPVSTQGLMPSFCRADGRFFTRESNPFNGGLYWKPGTYWNGGSWLRLQYMALAVGRLHGWSKAEGLMQRRLEAELSYDPDNPVSREYLSCNGSPKDSSIHRVFGWNVFILAINEWLSSRNF